MIAITGLGAQIPPGQPRPPLEIGQSSPKCDLQGGGALMKSLEEYVEGLDPKNREAVLAQSEQIVAGCAQVFSQAKAAPVAQGLAAAKLAAMWVDGHYPAKIRPEILKGFVRLIEQSIREREVERGHP